MLRLALLALLLANAGYFAWTQGWMASLGWTPAVQSEAHRLKQQIRPETLKLQPPDAPSQAAAPSPAAADAAAPTPSTDTTTADAGVCWQAGGFDDKQVATLRSALKTTDLPPDSWEMLPISVNGRWMVYLGKFPDSEALERKRAELRAKKITYDRAGGALDPGLSLGRFSSEEAATRELTQMLRQGVRGARVVQERPDATLYTLRIAQLSPGQQPVLERLQPAMAGKTWRNCPAD